jgi:hypothetical protein
MESDLLKINILTIILTGALLFLSGIVLYFCREMISTNMRFFLPFPPLAVASYIYTFNLFKQFNGNLPANGLNLTRELLSSTLIATLIFSLFTLTLVFSIILLRRLV